MPVYNIESNSSVDAAYIVDAITSLHLRPLSCGIVSNITLSGQVNGFASTVSNSNRVNLVDGCGDDSHAGNSGISGSGIISSVTGSASTNATSNLAVNNSLNSPLSIITSSTPASDIGSSVPVGQVEGTSTVLSAGTLDELPRTGLPWYVVVLIFCFGISFAFLFVKPRNV